jgi:hypothetical protein
MSNMKTEEPVPGQTYRHYKGNQYMVICVAIMEATMTPMVVYREVGVIGGKPWVRPMTEFMEDIRVGQKRVRRFAQVD